MWAFLYIVAVLVVFILMYAWLSECLEKSSHAPRDHKGELIERRLRDRRVVGKDLTGILLGRDRRKRQRRN